MSKSFKLILANSKGEKTYEKNFDSFGECSQEFWEKAEKEIFGFIIVKENREITHIYFFG